MASGPRVAVLSVTRDRIDYSKHCFALLKRNAGIRFSHYVFDNGSTDGTQAWLKRRKLAGLILSDTNVGVSVAMNSLLDLAGPDYDYYVKFDNDCEITAEGTLAAIIERMNDKLILSPRIMGLMNPPGLGSEIDGLGYPALIGGIFMCVPGWVYREYRYPEGNPVWGMDDVGLCNWFSNKGGRIAYVLGVEANHFQTTRGQWERYPEYFARRIAEGGPA